MDYQMISHQLESNAENSINASLFYRSLLQTINFRGLYHLIAFKQQPNKITFKKEFQMILL